MTRQELDTLAKQKQVFYVTQKLEGANGFEKTAYGLVIDCFLDNKNTFLTLYQISNDIKSKGIMLEPETLHETLSHLNYNAIFENFPEVCNIRLPFKLKDKIYQDFLQTADYTQKLRDYVERFLLQNDKSISFRDKLIELLLESIFYCNIKFLKHIVSAKDESPLHSLLSTKAESMSNTETEAEKLFNLLLATSSSDFDDILRCLILRMFDFLSLNFNPNYSSRIEKHFGGKFYYLDSSFIIRLLGFDGEFRRDRALDLIHSLNGIKDLLFLVHTKSIDESVSRIKELIGKNSKVLSKNPTIIRSIFNKDGDSSYKSPVVSLFLELYEQGRVRNFNDFSVYCENVKGRLISLIPLIKIDTNSLPRKLSRGRESVIRELKDTTDKSQKRIQFITSLLDYIDAKREANNYDISDIKYWLITTDQKTLNTDERYLKNLSIDNTDNKKGICIMPSELIRMLDGFSGEIRSDHVGVFKNYMMKSHVFPNQYTDDELTTICRIATLVEQTNLDEYKTDEMIERVLKDTSIKDIQKRLNRLALQKEKDQEIINLFIERNEDIISDKVSNVFIKVRKKAQREANRNWKIGSFALTLIYVLMIFSTIFNWPRLLGFNSDPYINTNIWSIIEIVIYLIGLFFNYLTDWIKKLKEKYIDYYVRKELDQLKD
jgi:hypothetical protein